MEVFFITNVNGFILKEIPSTFDDIVGTLRVDKTGRLRIPKTFVSKSLKASQMFCNAYIEGDNIYVS